MRRYVLLFQREVEENLERDEILTYGIQANKSWMRINRIIRNSRGRRSASELQRLLYYHREASQVPSKEISSYPISEKRNWFKV